MPNTISQRFEVPLGGGGLRVETVDDSTDAGESEDAGVDEDVASFVVPPPRLRTVPSVLQYCRQRNLLTNSSVLSIVAALFDGQFALKLPVGTPPVEGYGTDGLDQCSILFNPN